MYLLSNMASFWVSMLVFRGDRIQVSILKQRSKRLFRGFVGDEQLSSYIVIIMSHYKDLFERISRMESKMFLFAAQVCSKKGISLNQSYSRDGIETINPTQSGGVWILRVW